jgi:hypothetical protein
MAPSFEEASRAFRDFLASKGWPTEIVWVRAKDVLMGRPIIVYRDGEDVDDAVARDFEVGRERRLGVRIEALCTLGSATCATVDYPADTREAELMMFPEDGLEISAAVPRTEGEVRWPAC